MTKKERFIRASEICIKGYTEDNYSRVNCPFCGVAMGANCDYCVMYNINTKMGCEDFKTYRLAHSLYLCNPKNNKPRIGFHKKLIKLMKGLPAERFTKKGWVGFPEIDKIEKR